MDRGSVKRLMKRVAKDTTFQKSGFGLLGRLGCLKFVGGDGVQSVPPELPTVDACGLPMTVDFGTPLQSLQRTATIGGVILVADHFYYLTAAHPLATMQGEPPVGRGERCEEEPWDHAWSPMTIEDLDSEGEESNADGSEDMRRPMSENYTPEKIFPTHAHVFTCPRSDNLGQPPTSPQLVASFQDKLITNSFVQTASLEQDWALLVPEIAPISLINRFRYKGKDLDITDISNINVKCRPLLLHQKYPEPLTVACSEAASLIPLPGGDEMTIAYKVYHLAESGDSGSWIVDGKSGNLLGILVSASVQDECSYMLFSRAVFNSIDQSRENYFGSGSPVVTLPSRGHLSSAHTASRLLRQALRDQQWAIARLLLRDMDLTAIEVKDDPSIPQGSSIEIASLYGNESMVLALLEAGFAASQRALKTACFEGHDKVVEILLEAGASPTVDRDNLSIASIAGHERVVQLLLQRGAAASLRALELACHGGHEKVVKILLEAGANPDELSVFEEACANGRDKVVKILLEAGADPADPSNLCKAAKAGHEGVVQLLLQAGADASQDALDTACAEGKDKVVKILLEAGADPADPSILCKAAKAGHEGVVQLLLQAGADASQDALDTACAEGKDKVVKILLEAGTHPTRFNLSDAAGAGHEKLVQLLLPYTFAMTSRDVKFAFCEAVQNGHEDTVALFLQAHVYVDAWGIEALCLALREGHLDVVELLIDAGADVREARHILIEDASARDLKQIDRLLLAAGSQSSGQGDEAPIAVTQPRLARTSYASDLPKGQYSGKATNASVFPRIGNIGGVVVPSAGGVVKAGSGTLELAPGVKAKKQKDRSDTSTQAKDNPLGL
ncbi:hypothetical protein LTR67_010669 [Exophiala xenobiotica]